jgi:hypothetical protein
MMIGQKILRLIGQTGIPVVNTSNACASGANAKAPKSGLRMSSGSAPAPPYTLWSE